MEKGIRYEGFEVGERKGMRESMVERVLLRMVEGLQILSSSGGRVK